MKQFVTLPPEVQAVLAFVESGELLRKPDLKAVGDVVATTSAEQARKWISGEDDPSGLDEDELPDDYRDWVNLRETMAAAIHGDFYARDQKSDKWGLSDYLSRTLETALRGYGSALIDDFSEDILADLSFVCLSRFIGSKGAHAEFWERVYAAYRAGLLPSGWDGVYPAGKLAVFVPPDDESY